MNLNNLIFNENIFLLAQGKDTGILPSFLPLIFIFIIFYFLLIRPQSKKQKKLNSKKSVLKKGDKVILGGGILGQVSGFKGAQDETTLVEIAKEVQIEVIRATIVDVLITEEELNKRVSQAPNQPKKSTGKNKK